MTPLRIPQQQDGVNPLHKFAARAVHSALGSPRQTFNVTRPQTRPGPGSFTITENNVQVPARPGPGRAANRHRRESILNVPDRELWPLELRCVDFSSALLRPAGCERMLAQMPLMGSDQVPQQR